MGKLSSELYHDSQLRVTLQLMVVITSEDTNYFQLELRLAGLTELSEEKIKPLIISVKN